MDLGDITRFRLRRVEPYRGLVVDETTWADAHDYHREHLKLHALAFHSAGVAAGLEVHATPSEPDSISIGPGVALDQEGNIIVVGQERRVPIESVKPGAVFVVLGFQETRVNADRNAPRGAPPNRVVESYKVEVLENAPEGPGIELARVIWSGPGTQLRDAVDLVNPGIDEVDLRFRRAARTARPAPVNVGVAMDGDETSRLLGVANLLREVDNTAGYAAAFRGAVRLEEGNGGCDFLYLRNAVTAETAVTTLASHLARGGAVFADNCRIDGDDGFQASMAALTEKLGLRLEPLGRGNPLLNVRFPFSEAPPGAVEGSVAASGRFIVSTRDYGCAWSGSCGKSTIPREVIRGALEWGVNVALASVQPLPNLA